MEHIDEVVAQSLNELHEKRQKTLNESRKKGPPYKVGDWVWVLRPRSSPSTSTLDTWWVGPTKVLERLGDQSYKVQITPNRTFSVHASDMKPYVEDLLSGKPQELFHFLPTHEEVGITPGEWDVEAILNHRKGPDGKLQFLTRWENTQPGEETWEPVSHFILRYNNAWAQYCTEKGIHLDILDYLSGEPEPGVR